VHLKVADLERALEFYRDVLGFELTQRFGSSAAFLSAGGYHHHIGLNTWESEGGRPPAEGTTGLYHLAILYPTRAELGDALRRLQKAGVPLEGASDHGVSEALYLRDPDGNGVELYWDRPKEEWPRTSDGLAMYTRPLDLASLSAVKMSGEGLTRRGKGKDSYSKGSTRCASWRLCAGSASTHANVPALTAIISSRPRRNPPTVAAKTNVLTPSAAPTCRLRSRYYP